MIAGALELEINAGGFERGFTIACEEASCYGGGSGTCGYLKNVHAMRGIVGATLIPFPQETEAPTEGPPDDTNGDALAVGMAFTMVFLISVFCYFQYFFKGTLPTWLGGKPEAKDEEEEEEEESDLEMARRQQYEIEEVLGQEGAKTLNDLGNPDLRFGFGHAEYRKGVMKAVPLKADYTAAPAEVASSPTQRGRRYSMDGQNRMVVNPLSALFGTVPGAKKDEDADDDFIASLLGTSNITALASLRKEEVRATWGDAIQEQDDANAKEIELADAAKVTAAKNKRSNEGKRKKKGNEKGRKARDSDSDGDGAVSSAESSNGSSSSFSADSSSDSEDVNGDGMAVQRVPFGGAPAPAPAPVSAGQRGVAASLAVRNPLQSNSLSPPQQAPAQRKVPPTAPIPPIKKAVALPPSTPPAQHRPGARVAPPPVAASPASPAAPGPGRGVASSLSVRNPLALNKPPASRAQGAAAAPAAAAPAAPAAPAEPAEPAVAASPPRPAGLPLNRRRASAVLARSRLSASKQQLEAAADAAAPAECEPE